MSKMMCAAVVWLAVCLGIWAGALSATMELAGAWQVKVTCGGQTAVLTVELPDMVTVTDEAYERLALFQGPEWRRGTPLLGPKAEACSVAGALDPATLVVRAGPGATAQLFERGKDYQLEPRWAGFGRLEGGAIAADRPVYASYRYAMMRLDSVVQKADGSLAVRKGVPHVATPRPPEIGDGETRVGNVWLA